MFHFGSCRKNGSARTRRQKNPVFPAPSKKQRSRPSSLLFTKNNRQSFGARRQRPRFTCPEPPVPPFVFRKTARFPADNDRDFPDRAARDMAGETMSISELLGLNSPRGLLGSPYGPQEEVQRAPHNTGAGAQVSFFEFGSAFFRTRLPTGGGRVDRRSRQDGGGPRGARFEI